MYTNINIKNEDIVCSYVIEYDADNTSYRSSHPKMNVLSGDCLALSPRVLSVIRYNDTMQSGFDNWEEYNKESCTTVPLNFYFPRFSVDLYNPGVKYSLNAETWINGKRIILGSWLLSRSESLAAESVKTFQSQEYYECITIDIIDPHDLIYGDDWMEFRRDVCGEKYDALGETLNNTGSVLYLSLRVVENVDGFWVDCGNWSSGQNSINISKQTGCKDLTLYAYPNTTKILRGSEQPAINCDIKFNTVYSNDLAQYLRETYNLRDYVLKFGIAIGNPEDLYFVGESRQFHNPVVNYSFTKDYILSDGNFVDWEGWRPGINITCSLDVMTLEGDSIIYLLSNPIPLTQELYKYFVGGSFTINGKSVHKVDLNLVDMEVYNITPVNRIEQQVIQMTRSDKADARANIIQPVFFRASESQNIIIHPNVVETISINLDSYKSKVKSFKLKIDDVTFVELGRVSSGVLFRIIGSKLSKSSTSGNYYILDENGELVTLGKYKYSV